MVCECCKKREGVRDVKLFSNGTITKICVCQDCFNRLVFSSNEMSSGAPLGLLKYHDREEHSDGVAECPFCHTSISDFTSTGYLGCEKCYKSFSGVVNSMIKRVQLSAVHTGKRPKSVMNKKKGQASVTGGVGVKTQKKSGIVIATPFSADQTQKNKSAFKSLTDRLQKQLDEAVAEERYEDAVIISTKLRELKGNGGDKK